MSKDKSLKDKTIIISKGGKDAKYAMVKDRVQYLDKNHENAYSIDTKHWYYPEQRTWVVKAVLTISDYHWTGHAQETESDDYKQVNFASALENAETSAIGRACAAFGLGIQDSYASADEIKKAQNRGSSFNTGQTTMKFATSKQIDWMRSMAMEPSGFEQADDLDNWIESVLTIKPQQVPIFKVKDAINKIKEAAEDIVIMDKVAMENIEMPNITDQDIKDLENNEIPY